MKNDQSYSQKPHLTLVHDENEVMPTPTNFTSQKPKKKGMSTIRKRFYAFNIDVFCIVILQKVGLFSYMSFVNSAFEVSPFPLKEILLGNMRQLHLSTMLFTYFSYFLVSYYLGHGKTVGKTIMHLRVVSHEGSPYELSFMESFMRTVGYTINYIFMFMPFVVNFVRSDKRGVPDFFSQTEVMTESEFEAYLEALNSQEETFSHKSSAAAEVIPFNSDKEEQLDLFSA